MAKEDMTQSRSKEEILYLGFNQDGSCLAIGRRRGFDIFSAETAALLHREDCGVVRLIEMLFRTSLVALVGSARADENSPANNRQLTMWNTKARAGICQLQFPNEIAGVKMNHRRAIVLLRQKVHVFDLKTMKALHVIDRSDAAPGLDPGLAALCCDPERGLLAAPLVAGTQGAAVEARAGLVGVVDTHTLQPLGAVLAHRSPVRALCLNPTGQLLATASARGTVVRLWAVPSLTLLCSFRRGANECTIHGLGFATDSIHLLASASNGSVHIFRTPKEAMDGLRETSATHNPSPGRSAVKESSSGEAEDDDDMSEWNIVESERSGRLHGAFDDSPAAGPGLDNHVRKAKTIIMSLLQPCRDYLDGPGAVAWVHLGPEESTAGVINSASPGNDMDSLLNYVACLPSPSLDGGVLVIASRRGLLSTFDWRKGAGLLAARQNLSAAGTPPPPVPTPMNAPPTANRQLAPRPPPTGVAALRTPPIKPMPSPLLVKDMVGKASPQTPEKKPRDDIQDGSRSPMSLASTAADSSGESSPQLVLRDRQGSPLMAPAAAELLNKHVKRKNKKGKGSFTASPPLEERADEEALAAFEDVDLEPLPEAAIDKEEREAREAEDKAEQEARAKAEEEAKRKAEEDARIKAEEEAKAQAEEEAKAEAERQAKAKAAEEARVMAAAEKEAKAKAAKEAKAKAKAEKEAKAKAAEEAKATAKAEREAKAKARQEAEANAKAEREARAEEEARAKAEEEAKAKAEEEERARAEEEERARAEEEARIKAEAAIETFDISTPTASVQDDDDATFEDAEEEDDAGEEADAAEAEAEEAEEESEPVIEAEEAQEDFQEAEEDPEAEKIEEQVEVAEDDQEDESAQVAAEEAEEVEAAVVETNELAAEAAEADEAEEQAQQATEETRPKDDPAAEETAPAMNSRKAKRTAKQAAREERRSAARSTNANDSDDGMVRRRKGKGRRGLQDDSDCEDSKVSKNTSKEEDDLPRQKGKKGARRRQCNDEDLNIKRHTAEADDCRSPSLGSSALPSPREASSLPDSTEESAVDARIPEPEEADASSQQRSEGNEERIGTPEVEELDPKKAKKLAKKAAQRASAMASKVDCDDEKTGLPEALIATGKRKGKKGGLQARLESASTEEPLLAVSELNQVEDCSASWSQAANGRGKRRQKGAPGRGGVH